MAGVTKAARRSKNSARDQVEGASEQAQGASEAATGGAVARRRGDSGKETLTSELKDTIREAAIEILRPAAQTATRAVAKYAVTKGPDLLRDRVVPQVLEAGGVQGIAKNVAGKGGGLMESLGSGAKGLTDRLPGKDASASRRRLPVMEFADVGVDLETAYDQFTQFEDWPEFMQQVDEVEQIDSTTVAFDAGIWGLRQPWEAEIVEQVPCSRIVFRGDDEAETVVVATFHRLAENLTRVQIVLDSEPQGLTKRFLPGARMTHRALKSDLVRFKVFVEMRDDSTGAWRGRIEDGEIVDDEEPRGEDREEEPRDDEDEAPEAAEDEDYEDEEEPEPEAEEVEEDEEEEPRAEEEDEPEDEEEEDEPEDEEEAEDEPRAEADEDEESAEPEEPEEEEAPPPRRRRRKATTPRKASTPRKAAAPRRKAAAPRRKAATSSKRSS